MLPKKSRLTAAEVRAVLARGKSARRGAVAARFVPGVGPGKAAIVVSGKVARQATLRNRLRRAGYQALPLPLPPGHLVVFIQNREFKSADILSLCSTLT